MQNLPFHLYKKAICDYWLSHYQIFDIILICSCQIAINFQKNGQNIAVSVFHQSICWIPIFCLGELSPYLLLLLFSVVLLITLFIYLLCASFPNLPFGSLY